MIPDNKRMGMAIRRLRMQRDLQQNELAARAGIDASRISRYEKGHEFPDPANQMKLAAGLSITWAELIAEYEGLEISVNEGRVHEQVVEYESGKSHERAARHIAEALRIISDDRGK